MPPTSATTTSTDRECRCLMAGIKFRDATEGQTGPGTIVGYAAVFDKFSEDLGYFREKIQRGAFAGCMGDDVRALVDHDSSQIIGRSKNGTLRMQEDDLGLRVEIDLPDTQVGRDCATNVRLRNLDGMSFSFTTDEDSLDRSTDPPTRTLLRVKKLYDVGPVTYPAYTDTSAAMRSLNALQRADEARMIADSLSLAKARQLTAEALLLPSCD